MVPTSVENFTNSHVQRRVTARFLIGIKRATGDSVVPEVGEVEMYSRQNTCMILVPSLTEDGTEWEAGWRAPVRLNSEL